MPRQIEKGFAMRYLFPCECEIDSETGRYVLSCSSPSAVAEGNTLQKAKEEMQDLLLLILGDCIQFHEKFPEPAPLSGKGKEEVVTFSHLQTLKVQLINAMVEKNWRPVDLATSMHITRQEASRILSPRAPTKFETIAEALEVLGYRLDTTAVPVNNTTKRTLRRASVSANLLSL